MALSPWEVLKSSQKKKIRHPTLPPESAQALGLVSRDLQIPKPGFFLPRRLLSAPYRGFVCGAVLCCFWTTVVGVFMGSSCYQSIMILFTVDLTRRRAHMNSNDSISFKKTSRWRRLRLFPMAFVCGAVFCCFWTTVVGVCMGSSGYQSIMTLFTVDLTRLWAHMNSNSSIFIQKTSRWRRLRPFP